jgi:hypothetical protein
VQYPARASDRGRLSKQSPNGALLLMISEACADPSDDLHRALRLLDDALDGHTEAVTLYLRTLSLEPIAWLSASVALYSPGYDEVPE